MELLVTIGLDAPIVEALNKLDTHVLSFPALPRTLTIDGRVYVESARKAGRLLRPRAVVYYGYFDGPEAATVRRALAVAETPSFPSVRRTIMLDDKVLGLLATLGAGLPRLDRGYFPPGDLPLFEGERVLKWGNRHSGEDKVRARSGYTLAQPALAEPFIAGTSERVLLVGDRVWQLRYESDDWRKNVHGIVEPVEADPELVAIARRVASHLGLVVAGVDFIVRDEVPHLIEVNAYPSLDDAPGAKDAFVAEITKFWMDVISKPGSMTPPPGSVLPPRP
ncbi:MAG: ATP-grasp domain-containing protein [Deltaproteobacteria bacterium]|nr:ATP-grasp domain-containing protein [Deltaproteobacteria bacterium]